MIIKKVRQIKQAKPFKVFDAGMFLVAIVAIVLSYVILFGKKGQSIEIWHNGQLQTHSIHDDKELHIADEKIIIRIENGEVWIEHADCPDQVCVHMGRISKVNQSIACIPNNVVIRISGRDNEFIDSIG